MKCDHYLGQGICYHYLKNFDRSIYHICFISGLNLEANEKRREVERCPIKKSIEILIKRDRNIMEVENE